VGRDDRDAPGSPARPRRRPISMAMCRVRSLCWACAASGHAAAAPPMSVMNSRRFTAEYLPCLDRKDSTHSRKSAALRDFNFAYQRGLHHSTWSPSCAVSNCTRAGDLDAAPWLTFAAASRVSVSPARARVGSAMTSITGRAVFASSNLFISLCAAMNNWPIPTVGLPLGTSSSRGSSSRSAFHAAMPPFSTSSAVKKF
jgi:hypothetical protein